MCVEKEALSEIRLLHFFGDLGCITLALQERQTLGLAPSLTGSELTGAKPLTAVAIFTASLEGR